MVQDVPELVDEVRYLANCVALVDLDAAKHRLDRLIAIHGRAEVGAALVATAPTEIAAIADSWSRVGKTGYTDSG